MATSIGCWVLVEWGVGQEQISTPRTQTPGWNGSIKKNLDNLSGVLFIYLFFESALRAKGSCGMVWALGMVELCQVFACCEKSELTCIGPNIPVQEHSKLLCKETMGEKFSNSSSPLSKWTRCPKMRWHIHIVSTMCLTYVVAEMSFYLF